MSAPTSADDLLDLVRKSGLVEEGKLAVYCERSDRPTDARDAANDLIREGLITNFQSEQFLLGKFRGFTIGKYKLLERIGVGGMGQVFLCEHQYMKKRVALKVLPPGKADQPGALGRFYREARAAGSLDHPNVVRTFDIDQDGNLHFIVMEYVDGSNLLDVVKKFGPLDVGRAVHYVRQVADGLDYAFRNGIIHRDVKPGNVLIDRAGTAKILDMGLARFYQDQNDMLTVKYDDKIVLGTADYVAPEQIANSHMVDVRADIYALGATLYFLLAGHPPFPSGTVSQKLLWHRTKDPSPVCQARPDVPAGLGQVVARLMAKDPFARPQTPADVSALLAPWQPAEVPLPAEGEMPKLSPAAAESQQSGVGSGPKRSEAIPVTTGVRPPPTGSGRVPHPGPFAPVRSADNIFGATPVPMRLATLTPFVANAQPDVQTLENGVGRPTPIHTGPIYRQPLPSRADTEPPAAKTRPNLVLIGLVAAACAVTAGLATFLLVGF